jgi:hypothetical protein
VRAPDEHIGRNDQVFAIHIYRGRIITNTHLGSGSFLAHLARELDKRPFANIP